jgi:hypothetical protein
MAPPKIPYPKHPSKIRIRIINREIEDGLLSGITTTAEVALSEKLRDYFLRLGYTSVHVTGIIAQLLTQRKVRIDFREHTERLELVDPLDQLSNLQAISLLNDFIDELNTKRDHSNPSRITQNITVQPIRPLKG